MFTVKRAADDRLDVSVSGKLDDIEAVQMIDALLDGARGIDNGRMLIDVDDFQLPTLGAFRVELSFFPELFRLARQFPRAAVLADESWVRGLSNVESKLIPGLEIRSFRKDQRYQAESWLGA